ncbi:flagellar biosynthesis protein FlhA [bacterium]|nr:flagellar biosynthesis protein FlhA [bacterium]
MAEERQLSLNRLLRNSDVFLALGLLGTLVVMVLPMPPWLLDLLLVTSFTISVAILLVAVYAARPLDFSVFPTILLFATLFRLALNVASTRLVLLEGHQGTAAAGHVIETFGNMVVGGSYIVGTVVFLLLIIINFIVITKGSGRVAEVAARFVLDAIPGKQMSIDADLTAGVIDREEAQSRRKKIESEAEFYGAMDGASKFVRGDAIAGILITVVNIIGGLAIGVLQKGLSVGDAAQIYTLMTIGDGLVTQIPSLVVSTAAGIIVTRAASGNELSKDVTKQILFQPRAIGYTAVILVFLGLLPGIPSTPFFTLAVILGSVSYLATQQKKADEVEKVEKERKAADAVASDTQAPPEVDILELQLGYGLVPLVEGEQKSDLVERVFGLRKEFARELGIVVPKVRIKDNLEIQPAEYRILIKGVSVGGGELMPGYLMAMDPGGADSDIPGISTKEPVFGLPALWIQEKHRERAQIAGYTVVDNPTIVATHLSEIVRKHASELIGRQALHSLIDTIEKSNPKVVEELNKHLSLGVVLKVCQNLLREQVPMRDLLTVLETLANYAPTQKDPDLLTEHVRAALARTITQRFAGGSTEMEVLTMEPGLEDQLLRSYQRGENGPSLQLEPGMYEKLIKGLQGSLERTVFASGTPVLLCHPLIRSLLRKHVERYIPNLMIISANEIASFAKIRMVGSVHA